MQAWQHGPAVALDDPSAGRHRQVGPDGLDVAGTDDDVDDATVQLDVVQEQRAVDGRSAGGRRAHRRLTEDEAEPRPRRGRCRRRAPAPPRWRSRRRDRCNRASGAMARTSRLRPRAPPRRPSTRRASTDHRRPAPPRRRPPHNPRGGRPPHRPNIGPCSSLATRPPATAAVPECHPVRGITARDRDPHPAPSAGHHIGGIDSQDLQRPRTEASTTTAAWSISARSAPVRRRYRGPRRPTACPRSRS